MYYISINRPLTLPQSTKLYKSTNTTKLIGVKIYWKFSFDTYVSLMVHT